MDGRDTIVACGASNFYCEADHDCILLAANTTALCCPKSKDCTRIQPIWCDLSLETPGAEIQTDFRDGKLQQCADKCCPWGYHCDANKLCWVDEDQSKPPPGMQDSSSSVSSTTSVAARASNLVTTIFVAPPHSSTSSETSTTTSTSSTASTSSATPSVTSSVTSSATLSVTPSTASTLLPLITTISTSAAPASETSQASVSSSPALTAGDIVGISVGGFAFISLISVALFFIRRMQLSIRAASDDEQGPDTAVTDVKEVPPEYSAPKSPRAELHNTEIYELAG